MSEDLGWYVNFQFQPPGEVELTGKVFERNTLGISRGFNAGIFLGGFLVWQTTKENLKKDFKRVRKSISEQKLIAKHKPNQAVFNCFELRNETEKTMANIEKNLSVHGYRPAERIVRLKLDGRIYPEHALYAHHINHNNQDIHIARTFIHSDKTHYLVVLSTSNKIPRPVVYSTQISEALKMYSGHSFNSGEKPVSAKKTSWQVGFLLDSRSTPFQVAKHLENIVIRLAGIQNPY